MLNQDEAGQDRALPASGAGTLVTGLQGLIEAEIARLEPEDAALFMEEFGIRERGADKVIRLSFQLLDLRSFFTINGMKCARGAFRPAPARPRPRARCTPTCRKASSAPEVMRCADLLAVEGREAALRSAGKLRLEGRDYEVQDGDVINIRFNV